MHVAVLGAGALGSAYAGLLAARTRTDVTFVVRSTDTGKAETTILEAVNGDRTEVRIPRTLAIPREADVILLAVGTEDLPGLRPLLDAGSASIVVLTPMMPRDYTRMRSAFGERVLAAMPAIVSYRRDDGVFRYWQPPAPTKVDEPRAGEDGRIVRVLAAIMNEAGLDTRLELGVHESNPASTVCAIPIGMSIALAGSLEAVAADAQLCGLTHRACREGVRLGRAIGRPELPMLLAPLVATRPGLLALSRLLSAEQRAYAEHHFGQKLRAQHRMMAAEMVALAVTKHLPHAAIEALASRLSAELV